MDKMIQIWGKILDQSLIMKSAIESDDLDVFENALEDRKELINILIGIHITDNEQFQSYFDRFQEIEKACEIEMARFREKLQSESLANRKKQHETIKNKQVHDRYQMNLDHSGSSLDSKK
jgi:hypothetical protein